MTLRSHHKIINRSAKQIGSRCRSRDQSPELLEIPPNPRIKHYNSTESLYNEHSNSKKRNRHDMKVQLKPQFAKACEIVTQQIIEYKEQEKKNNTIIQ